MPGVYSGVVSAHIALFERRLVMASLERQQIWIFESGVRAALVGLALAIMFVLTVAGTQAAQAQTYNVIYNFTGGSDGAEPGTTLTLDKEGNFYGTAAYGGAGHGTVFKLTHAVSAGY
jgi:uncharacterized repeat protein (TIGR03803 family)